MNPRTKYILIVALASVSILTGCYYLFHHKSPDSTKKYPSFNVRPDSAGQPLSKEEEILFISITNSNKTFIESLNKDEKELFDSVVNKVKNAVKENPKVKIKYKTLLTKEELPILTKIRRHKREYKVKSHMDKKTFASMMKKLDREQIMEVKLYVG